MYTVKDKTYKSADEMAVALLLLAKTADSNRDAHFFCPGGDYWFYFNALAQCEGFDLYGLCNPFARNYPYGNMPEEIEMFGELQAMYLWKLGQHKRAADWRDRVDSTLRWARWAEEKGYREG